MTGDFHVAMQHSLHSRHLFTVEFEVSDGLLSMGASPFGEVRMGYISGGRFFSSRIEGLVLPGGGNWSRSGRLGAAASVGTFDARAVLKVNNGDLIYMTYTGRSVIPDDVRTAFGNPATADVDPARYYLRIAPVFETASETYGWLNGILAVGAGERTDFGARHQIHEIL